MDEAFETDEKGNDLKISSSELEENEDELIRLMHERFLRGDDHEFFDYKEVDENENYDDRRQKELNDEEKWFEEAEEE